MREGKEYTAEDVLLGYANPAYDQMAKRLLAQKKVMARILKRTVPEFAEASLADIADKYIEGELQIGEIPVHADKTNAVRNAPRSPKELRGNNTENASATEGWVHFDILFQAKAPKTGELITLIINLEAQKTQARHRLGYALLRRAVYYASRLISSQKETEFTGIDYDNIKKVYTIWLCMDSPTGKSYINRYDIAEKHLLHRYKEEKRDYDLMSIVIVYLGDTAERDVFIRFLYLLFRDSQKSAEEKKRILADEFDLDITSDMEEEMKSMCNLSEGIYERAWAKGMEQGMAKGEENIRTEIVLSMLAEKTPLDTIMRLTKAPAERIRALGKEHGFL